MKSRFAGGLAVVAIASAATLAGGGAAQATSGTATGWCGYGYVDCHPRDAGIVGVIEDTVTGLVGDRYGYGYGRPRFPGFF
ncbi:MAG: hypothetical protein HOW59_26495 [Nonomuraea sp.]|nr:hypothetical protein [Nonomuraea sp.]